MDYMIYGLYKPPAGMQWNSCKSVLVFPPLCSQSPAASTILDSILVAKFYPPKGLKDCKGINNHILLLMLLHIWPKPGSDHLRGQINGHNKTNKKTFKLLQIVPLEWCRWLRTYGPMEREFHGLRAGRYLPQQMHEQ